MSQWPELQPQPDPSPWRTVITSLVAAVLGGCVGWTLGFVGLGLWGLAVGALVTLIVLTIVAGIDDSQRLTALVTYAVAFTLLSWPVLWIAAGLVRYWLTGQTLGS